MHFVSKCREIRQSESANLYRIPLVHGIKPSSPTHTHQAVSAYKRPDLSKLGPWGLKCQPILGNSEKKLIWGKGEIFFEKDKYSCAFTNLNKKVLIPNFDQTSYEKRERFLKILWNTHNTVYACVLNKWPNFDKIVV